MGDVLFGGSCLSVGSFRRRFQSVLGGDAVFLRIKEDSKAPISSFAPGKRNRLKNIPRSGNFAVIPRGRLFVLDFDCHNGVSSVFEQIEFFSRFLGVDLRQSLAVVTQSGGIHVYLRFPESVTVDDLKSMPRGSLRGYSRFFSEVAGEQIELDSDIRTAAANSYVVGPTSVISGMEGVLHNSYWVADDTVGFNFSESVGIVEVSSNSVEKFRRVVELKKDYARPVRGLALLSSGDDFSSKAHQKPDDNSIVALKSAISRRSGASYHSQRAFIKSALHCCYDDYSVACVCIELGVDKDSYTSSSIGFKALLVDLSRFKPDATYHGPYCAKGREIIKNSRKTVANGVSLEENLVGLREKTIARGFERYKQNKTRVNPRVLDPVKVSDALLALCSKRNSKPSQQYLDAMAVFDFFIQPLCNVGARRILLSRSALKNMLGLSDSRATQALRLLRNANIISVYQRQRTGLAPTYDVSEGFTNFDLTRGLRRAWAASPEVDIIKHAPIYFNRLSGSFIEVFSGERVPSPRDIGETVSVIEESEIVGEPLFVGPGAAISYLRAEAQHLGFLVTDTGLVNLDTGELIG